MRGRQKERREGRHQINGRIEEAGRVVLLGAGEGKVKGKVGYSECVAEGCMWSY